MDCDNCLFSFRESKKMLLREQPTSWIHMSECVGKTGSDAPTVSKLKQERVTIAIWMARSDTVYNCTLNSGCMDAKLRVKTLCFIMIYCITHFPLAQVRHFKSEQSYLGLTNKCAAQAIGFSTCCSNKSPKSKKHFLFLTSTLPGVNYTAIKSCAGPDWLWSKSKQKYSLVVSSQLLHPELRSPEPAAHHSWTPACQHQHTLRAFCKAAGHPSGSWHPGHLCQCYWLLQLQHNLSKL